MDFTRFLSFCSAQSFTVDIPNDLECKDCTIRLVRQALEWSNRYLFWSCADVDILQPRDYAEDCSGNTSRLFYYIAWLFLGLIFIRMARFDKKIWFLDPLFNYFLDFQRSLNRERFSKFNFFAQNPTKTC